MKKSIFVVFLIALCLALLSGCNVVKNDNMEYQLQAETNTYTLTAYKDLKSITVLTVPDQIDGINVTSIAKHGLSNSEYLTDIILGDNISEIDSWGIRNNTALERITVSDNNPHFKSVDGVLFSKDGKTLISFPNHNAERYIVPEGVEIIQDMAFYKCDNLKEVTLASTVKTLGKLSFLKTLALEKITLNEGLTAIGQNAFLGCEKLTTLDIPNSIESIGEYAYYNCVNLLQIRVHKAEADISLGKKWYPTKAGQNIKELSITYGEGA